MNALWRAVRAHDRAPAALDPENSETMARGVRGERAAFGPPFLLSPMQRVQRSFRDPRQPIKPSPPKPSIIMAQVDGSGTPEASGILGTPGLMSRLNWSACEGSIHR